MPTSAAPTSNVTDAPTAAPTAAILVALNVTSPVAPVTVVLGAVRATLTLAENATVPVQLVVRRLLPSDIVLGLQTVSTPFPADLVPVTGLVISGFVPSLLRVAIDTALASPYVADGRTVRTFATSQWIEPGELCAPNDLSLATSVDDVWVHTIVCHENALLVVADPRGTTARTCPSGRYDCDCSSTSAFSVAPLHRTLYAVSIVLHASASVLDVEFKGRDAAVPSRLLGYAALVAASALNPLEDTDSTWRIAGLDYDVLRYGLLTALPAAAAAVFVVGMFARCCHKYALLVEGDSSDAVGASPGAVTSWRWVGYDPFENQKDSSQSRWHRYTRLVHQVLLAVSLAIALELVHQDYGLLMLVFGAGVVLECFSDTQGREYLYWVSRVAVIGGLAVAAAFLLAEPCLGAYGADRPATVLRS